MAARLPPAGPTGSPQVDAGWFLLSSDPPNTAGTPALILLTVQKHPGGEPSRRGRSDQRNGAGGSASMEAHPRLKLSIILIYIMTGNNAPTTGVDKQHEQSVQMEPVHSMNVSVRC